ncbi:MAG: UDP-N-acetylglucosamine 2-epimerase (non-hydrolyzing) [Chloroflexi bacterium]|nr:MAG: UDP-N-acetylglucosamine 2-epimerase (non-hydrolyzing) [Chloroflexota bacterium]MBL1193117.1 UDP-N-acetylglucosamine 2-epimerase (non-hydrolyzing) [Chloroflexota bacterium]NOH10410.1 UDP-N-acetylglucosamine 2-epimerase (non-hydrolyzing) [Chloroflexota bacterium]
MKTILTVVGARPQFIKAAPVSKALEAIPKTREIIVHTGQHYDDNLSGQFFQELNIPSPQHNLGIGSATHGHQTGQMLAAIEDVLLYERPDVVLVYGDTNSTLAGALAAAKLHIPIAHVEAGLRSFNRKMPEEINRVLTDHLSDFLFVPTITARSNLDCEGFSEDSIYIVGDVMFDALLHFSGMSASQTRVLERLDLAKGDYILTTIHRAENTDDPIRMKIIRNALTELAKSYTLVLPLHPRTRKALTLSNNRLPTSRNLKLIDPLGYLDMLMLEKNAALIITDSGGVQKEAYFHQVPCITLRDETEWTELVEQGWNKLVPPKSVDTIISSVQDGLLTKPAPQKDQALFGTGNASKIIVNVLCGNEF